MQILGVAMQYSPGLLELRVRVRERGADQLVYTFRSIAEASEMMAFLKDFFPAATFELAPVRH